MNELWGVADIIDRFTIAKLRYERIGNSESEKEYKIFSLEIANLIKKYYPYDIEQWCKMMYNINSSIWFLEAGLKGNKEMLPNPHFLDDPRNEKILANAGKNAFLIRKINDLRKNFGNIINKLTKSGFQKQRKDHISG